MAETPYSVDREREEQVARKRAKVLPRMKPEEVSVEVWLSAYRLLFPDRRSVRTRRNEADMLRPFIRAHGRKKMRDITPLQAQAWALENPSHVRWLKAAWRKAVLFRIAEVNVWNVVEMPPRSKERRRPPSELELQGMLRRARELDMPVFAAMIEVAAYTGAREAGLIRLRWRDVEGLRMTVTEKGEKTRTLVVPQPARDALNVVWGLRGEHTRFGNRGWAQMRFVFPWDDGGAFTADRVQKAWRRVRGDFPHGFHSLRHYAATWWSERGADPLDVAVQLGHMDSQGRPYARLVQRTYDHPDPELALLRLASL